MKTKMKLLSGIIVTVIVIGFGFLILQKPNEVGHIKNSLTPANKENKEIKNDIKTSYKNYVNYNFNIKLLYPDSYNLQEGLMGTVAIFLSPEESFTDLFHENLNIIIQDLSDQPMTLDEYNDLSIGQIETYINNSKIISSKKTTLAGKSAYEVIYTGQQEQYNLKWRQLWTVINNKAYVLSYTAEINKFDNYFEVFNKMIDSFEILNVDINQNTNTTLLRPTCNNVIECVDKKFNCSIDSIDLSHQYNNLTKEQLKGLKYNYYSPTCHKNECRCIGGWRATN